MKSLKLALLLTLSFVSLSQNIFSQNDRKIASVDCINCEGSIETNSSEVSSALKVIEKIVPIKLNNTAIFEKVKKDNTCGEYLGDDFDKYPGRLKKNQKYFKIYVYYIVKFDVF